MTIEGIVAGTKRIILVQVGGLVLGALLSLSFSGPAALLSFMLGGVSSLLPSLVFSLRVKKLVGAEPKAFLGAFFGAEAIKFALTIISLILFIRIPGVSALFMLLGFASLVILYWFALLTSGPAATTQSVAQQSADQQSATQPSPAQVQVKEDAHGQH